MDNNNQHQPEIRDLVRRQTAALFSVALAGVTLWAAADDPALAAGPKPLQGSATYVESTDGSLPLFEAEPYRERDPEVIKADELTGNFQLGAAETIYRRILTENPEHPGAHHGLGKVYYYRTTSSDQSIRDRREDLLRRSVQSYLTALRYEPGYVEARVDLGKIYLEQGRLPDAREEFGRAMRLDPDHSEAVEMLGAVYLAEKNYNEALPYLRRAIRLDSGNSSAHYRLGEAYIGRGEYHRAIESLQTALYQFPNNAPVRTMLGVAYEHQGNGAAAVAEYKKALAVKAEYLPAALRLADHYAQRADNALALEVLKNAWEGHRENRELLFRIAELSLENDQPDVADHYYHQILVLDPANRQAREGISRAKAQLAENAGESERLADEWASAESAMHALGFDPSNTDARLIRVNFEDHDPNRPGGFGRAIYHAGWDAPAYEAHQSFSRGEVLLDRYRFREAEEAFLTAIRGTPEAKDVIAYGEMFLSMGLPGMAEEAFREVLSREPDNPVARLGLQKAAESREKSLMMTDEASYHRWPYWDHANPAARERLLKSALEANAANAQAHWALARHYERDGHYGRAADHYYAWLQLNPGDTRQEKIERKIQRLIKKHHRS